MNKKLLEKLYNQNVYNQEYEILAYFKDLASAYSVELINIRDKKVDCNISHFGYNFYFRTPYGMKCKKYKSLNTMYQAIKKTALHNGLDLEKITIKTGGDIIKILK